MKVYLVEMYVHAESDEELKEIIRPIVRQERGKSGASFAMTVEGRPVDILNN